MCLKERARNTTDKVTGGSIDTFNKRLQAVQQIGWICGIMIWIPGLLIWINSIS